MFQFQELELAATEKTLLKTRASLKDLQKRANLKLGWIQSEKKSNTLCLDIQG
jgi:hypothetical protein